MMQFVHSLAGQLILWPLGAMLVAVLLGGLLGYVDAVLSQRYHAPRRRDPEWWTDQVRQDTQERLRRLQAASRTKGDR